MLTDLPVSRFLDTAASAEPVPGGGSVSALCGALAAALTRMVAHLTVGRKKYAAHEADMMQIIDRAGLLQAELTGLIDLDAEAYADVMNAYRMPKATETEQILRAEAVERATRHAAEVPLTVARTVARILPDIARVGADGNRNAVTDACVAAMCASAAIRGALLNVRVNIASLSDEMFVTGCRAEADRLSAMALDVERDLLRLTDSLI